MAVTLRLTRKGLHSRPFYRVVATDQQNKRDGKFIEVVGVYDPMVEPSVIKLKDDRIKYWVAQGAQMSDLVRSLIKKSIPGLVEAREKHQLEKIVSQRKKRKARLASTGGKQAKAPAGEKPAKKKSAAKSAKKE